jgi:hypothetical protein
MEGFQIAHVTEDGQSLLPNHLTVYKVQNVKLFLQWTFSVGA